MIRVRRGLSSTTQRCVLSELLTITGHLAISGAYHTQSDRGRVTALYKPFYPCPTVTRALLTGGIPRGTSCQDKVLGAYLQTSGQATGNTQLSEAVTRAKDLYRGLHSRSTILSSD